MVVVAVSLLKDVETNQSFDNAAILYQLGLHLTWRMR